MRGGTVPITHTVPSERKYEHFEVRIRDLSSTGYLNPGGLPESDKKFTGPGESTHRLYRDVETGLIVSNIRAFENGIRKVEENEPQADD